MAVSWEAKCVRNLFLLTEGPLLEEYFSLFIWTLGSLPKIGIPNWFLLKKKNAKQNVSFGDILSLFFCDHAFHLHRKFFARHGPPYLSLTTRLSSDTGFLGLANNKLGWVTFSVWSILKGIWSPSAGMYTREKENSLLTTDPYILLNSYISRKGKKFVSFKKLIS